MYHSSKLELMAIVWTLDRLRQFLVGIKFTVVTDCQALVYMNAKKTTNPQIARWYNLIQEYDFEIRHKPGEKMAHVDGMSRAPVDDPRDTMEEIVEKNLEVCLTITLEEQILMIQHSDPELRDLIQIFRKDPCDRTVGEQNRINDYSYRRKSGRGARSRRYPPTQPTTFLQRKVQSRTIEIQEWPNNYKKLICELVEAGSDVNIPDRGKITPFFQLLLTIRDNELFELFIEKGADIHLKYGEDQGVDAKHVNRSGNSALFYAAKGNEPNILEYFIKSGFDVNVRGSYGATPLMYAARSRDSVNARMLLNAGAKINVRDRDDFTPLKHALYSSNSSVIRLFVENGAEVDIKDDSYLNLITRVSFDSGKGVDIMCLLKVTRPIDFLEFLEKHIVLYNFYRRLSVIKEMIKKFLLINPVVSKPNLPEYLSIWWDNCKLQVPRMEEHKLGKSYISLRAYLLENDIQKRANFLYNNTTMIRQELELNRSWYKANADHYIDTIEEYFEDDIKRAKTLHKWNAISQERLFKPTTVTVRLQIAEHLADDNLL
ncbi:hypothetical protein LAZ67_12003427 [Cordylochernes scorpioides]|uniref:Reverse transcriptase RNase H-like domain-containing protein n=1 Tax=Cordylochernes scorpioides TaxID=51811 RepID=A0ABY6L2W2_9ARAC|nr:hypothetical protein LAZ67_12003427 [Cordylochernes scorpioides]